MKKIILFSLIMAAVATGNAQWSNTTNQFYDSLDMPVAQAANDQKNPLVVKSDPDGGYFVIWEDARNAFGNWDIYAQKYDKNGKRLWAINGVPVATGDAPDQQYSNISNGVVNYYDYQSVSHAASDGNGGFYITWQLIWQALSVAMVCLYNIYGAMEAVFLPVKDMGLPFLLVQPNNIHNRNWLAMVTGDFLLVI